MVGEIVEDGCPGQAVKEEPNDRIVGEKFSEELGLGIGSYNL